MPQYLDTLSSENWLVGFLTGGLGVVLFGWVLRLLQQLLRKREEKREAVGALWFETASNIRWCENIFDTWNYLRDEAWREIKNKGYISYLSAPIPGQVILVYDFLHRLNHQIKVARHPDGTKRPVYDERAAMVYRDEFVKEANQLIEHFNMRYKKIGRNYKE